jgi:hypothetical protein
MCVYVYVYDNPCICIYLPQMRENMSLVFLNLIYFT